MSDAISPTDFIISIITAFCDYFGRCSLVVIMNISLTLLFTPLQASEATPARLLGQSSHLKMLGPS